MYKLFKSFNTLTDGCVIRKSSLSKAMLKAYKKAITQQENTCSRQILFLFKAGKVPKKLFVDKSQSKKHMAKNRSAWETLLVLIAGEHLERIV